MRQLRIGVVGAGSTGTCMARALAALPDAAFTGAFDNDIQRSHELAKLAGGRGFVALDDLLDAVDAVAVTTPAHAHRQIVEQALAADCHVLIANPLAESLPAAQRLLDSTLRSPHLTVQVGQVECYDPTFVALATLLGDERPVAATFRRTVPFDHSRGALDRELGPPIQDLYLALSLFGHDIAKIDAQNYDALGDRSTLVELLMDDGREVRFVASMTRGVTETIVEAETTRMRFVADLRAGVVYEQAQGTPLDDAVRHVAPHAEPHLTELQEFVTCIKRGRQPTIDVRAGFNVLVIADAIERPIARTRECSYGSRLPMAQYSE